jgi:hypothetical protein
MLHGLDPGRAGRLSDTYGMAQLMLDDMLDAVRDLRRGHADIPEEEVAERHIDPAALFQCRSLEELAQVDGVAGWFVAQAELHGRRLRDALSQVREDLSHITPRWKARAAVRDAERVLSWLELIESTWRRYLPGNAKPVQPGQALREVYHYFPSYAQLPPGAYAALEHGKGWWPFGAQLIAPDVEAVGLSVSAETMERWTWLCAAVDSLDDLLDEAGDPAEAEAIWKRLILGTLPTPGELPFWMLPPRLLDVVMVLRAALAELETRDEVLRTILEFLPLAARKRAASNPRRYARALLAEADVSGRMLGLAMNASERAAPEFPAVSRRLRKAMAVHLAFDSCNDHRQDYASGTVGVAPTPLNSVTLRLQAARLVAPMAIEDPARVATMLGSVLRSRLRGRRS